MCIYIRYSMSIIEKVFHYEENEISVIKCRDEIWSRGKDIAKALGYEKTHNVILKHVDDDNKSILEDIKGPQDTVHKGIDSFKKGYLCGSPDLIINNLHKHYTGFCIEFKSPKGNGALSPDQSMMLRQYQNNGFKTLVSNDYDHIIEQIIEYFRDVRIKCSHCPRRFISSQSLRNHIKFFHKM